VARRKAIASGLAKPSPLTGLIRLAALCESETGPEPKYALAVGMSALGSRPD